MKQRTFFTSFTLAIGLCFLYFPIVMLMLFSFNKLPSVSIWGGLSLKWYYSLLEDEILLNAMWFSLKIATISATCAVLIGMCAAIVTTRFGHFRGRLTFEGMVMAPLIIPDVVMGLASLLLFITLEKSLGLPRGQTTITLVHITLTLAYVFIIIRARLSEFDYSLIEAALDLGARPLSAFFQVTFPLIFPSLVAAWLLAFTLSFDDVVLASFVSGAGATTLPMVIFSHIRLGVTPQINALATILVSCVMIGVILSSRKRKEK